MPTSAVETAQGTIHNSDLNSQPRNLFVDSVRRLMMFTASTSSDASTYERKIDMHETHLAPTRHCFWWCGLCGNCQLIGNDLRACRFHNWSFVSLFRLVLLLSHNLLLCVHLRTFLFDFVSNCNFHKERR